MQAASLVRRMGIFMAASLLWLALTPAGQAGYANPSLSDVKNSSYWLDRGGMLCTYGNFKGAIRAYEKALTLAPMESEIHFSMGVAYTQMGAYATALASMDKAISRAPDNARYRYGRAWCLLLAGRTGEAQPDFQRAAELGSIEARNYLQRHPYAP